MYSKSWEIIKDDVKKTFEVCGVGSNNNHFTNSILAMQKAGMNVSCMTLPVTNKASNKEVITVTGYKRENGLYERLQREFRDITMQSFDFNDID